MSDAPESKKRNKKRYGGGGGGGGHRSKRYRGSRELEVGMRGVLITCNMNERKCTAEALNLLSEYADELYGPEKLQGEAGASGSEEEEGEEEEDDVEAALKKEVSQLKAASSSSRKRQHRFQALDSGANNVIFIRTTDLEPDKLVHDILSDLHATKKKKSRVILRMLPVSGTCRAFPEDMERYLSSFLEPWFKAPRRETYQIAFKARNSSHNKRDDIIKSIAGVVEQLNPLNKVDLTAPELTVIVEVIRSVCCVSVVRHYALYRKYNLQEVVKDDAPKQEGGGAVTVAAVAAGNQEEKKQEVVKTEEREVEGGAGGEGEGVTKTEEEEERKDGGEGEEKKEEDEEEK